MLKYKYFLAVIAGLSLAISVHNCAFSGEEQALELGIKKMSFGYQSDVISALYDHKVPFYIDNEGILKYSGEYEQAAREAIDTVDKRPVVQFSDPKIASLFVLVLKKHSVDFKIRQGNNDMEIHIVYTQKDSQLVDNTVYPEFQKALIVGRKTGFYKVSE